MTVPQVVLTSVLLTALAVQALIPSHRILVILCGAAVAALVASLGGVATTAVLFARVPWDVILILVGLGLLTEVLASTRVFGRLAVAFAVASRARPRRLLLLFATGMYLVSGLVNNLTALLLVLPVLLRLLRLLGVDQRFASWTLGALLVACNLGGAATPIGDFPAILLLGGGRLAFGEYLVHAGPPTAAALAAFLAITTFVVRPDRAADDDATVHRVALAVLRRLHRNVAIDRPLLIGALVIECGLLAAWLLVPRASGIGPELICWLGAGVALLLRPRLGEALVRHRVDMEAVLYFLGLFVMVGAVQASGVLDEAARHLAAWDAPASVRLIAFLVAAALLTGLLSAGPSMAALLGVADGLAAAYDPVVVYVGLALAVCAGSSLFLTAATSGPLAEMLTDRAELRDQRGAVVRFGFRQFLPVGLLGFSVILATALGYVLLVG